jgi:hypothetical protein
MLVRKAEQGEQLVVANLSTQDAHARFLLLQVGRGGSWLPRVGRLFNVYNWCLSSYEEASFCDELDEPLVRLLEIDTALD